MLLSENKTKNSVSVMLVDIIIINLSIILAYLLRFNFSLPTRNFHPYIELFFWISLTGVFFLNTYQLYSVSARTRWDDQFYSIFLAVTLNLMLSITLSYISANYAFPRTVFILSGFLQIIFLSLWRYGLWLYTKKMLGDERAVIIGTKSHIEETVKKINKFSESHINIIKTFTVDKVEPQLNSSQFFNADDIKPETILVPEQFDIAIITPGVSSRLREAIVSYCYSISKEVMLVPDFYEVLLVKAPVSLIDDMPFLSIKDYNKESDPIKRIFDLFLASTGFVLLSPVMLIIAVLIKIDSPGPVIFKQERVTRGGRVFVLYKFRTMVENAEKLTGPVLASEADQRATRIGRILRLARIDELPQLVNVIKGDMSMVGPRPERPIFVKQYSEEINGYGSRHTMKPGITGIAQVAGKYNTGPREKLVFDLLYAKRSNLLVDLRIILQTLKVLFLRDKAS